MTMSSADFNCTIPQARFHALTCRYPLFVGGYGSGKTQAMIDAAIMDACHSRNALIAIYEPTFDLIELTVAPRLIEKLDELKILHHHNKSKHKITTRGKNRIGSFIMRSLDNPDTIVSYQSYRAHIDELDTLKLKKAEQLWIKIIGRNRQIPKGFTKHTVNNRVSVYTTPEGFRFAHKRWIKDKPKDKANEYNYVHAKSTSNPFLPSTYIQSLFDTYTPELAEAYINGKFVNLTSGTIYHKYNREAHNSNETIRPNEHLFIGNDFNITKMAATIYVKREGGKQWHAVDELVDLYDTEELVRVINERYRDKGHPITIYPDASGNSRKTNARVSDVAQLHQARYQVRHHASNPPVQDRINAMNTALSKGIVYINARACPTVADCLEQQAYDPKNGEPDKKSGNDHQNDATTYPIAFEFPVKKPVAQVSVRFN